MELVAKIKTTLISITETLFSLTDRAWPFVLSGGSLMLLVGMVLKVNLIVSLAIGLTLLVACFLMCARVYNNNTMALLGVAALAVRFFISFVFNYIFSGFGMDSLEYHYMAKEIVNLLSSGVNYVAVPFTKQYFPNFIAIFYYAFGSNRLAVTFIVNFFCVASGLFVYLTCDAARMDKPVGYFSSIAIWFMPGFLFFTSDLLKDSSILFLTALSFYLFSLIIYKKSSKERKLLLTALLVLVVVLNSAFRFYVFAPIVIGLGLGLIVHFFRGRGLKQKLVVTLMIIGLCALFYVLANRYLERYLNLSIDKLFEYINNERQWNFAYASAGIKGYDISSLLKALKALPELCVHYLAQPFPTSWISQDVALYIKLLIPDMLIWYVMLPFVFWGSYMMIKSRNILGISIIGYLVVFLIINALLVGNVGAIYRYRLQFQMPAFILIGIGMYDVVNKVYFD